MQIQQLLDDIDERMNRGDGIIVAIDGMAAAGKSTLAARLKDRYSCEQCNVIPMDHFFLRFEQRTPQRLATPGGNIDSERFYTEVVESLKSGKTFSYRPYDCSKLDFSKPVSIAPKQLTVVEGVYSYVCMRSILHISVFMHLDAQTQSDRLLRRNPALYERYLNEWLPMENKYFEHFAVQENCDYVLD